MPKIVLVTHINAPLQRCFDLARSIDLHKLSTSHTGEEAIAGVTSGLIGKGQAVTWRARHFGIRMQLSSRITGFSSNEYFTDEMEKGPFKYLKHRHSFSFSNDITTMKDEFDFSSPLSFLGWLADTLVLRAYLQKFLEARNQVIKAFAESEKWTEILN